MRVDGYLGRIVAVKLRDSKFRTTIRQRALPYVMNDESMIYKTSSALLDENWDGRPLRLIGVSVSGLIASGNAEQPSLFDMDERRRKMIEAVDSLRDRFGDAALGVGGIPRGRVTEIYGPEASGKTTLALHIIAEAQKAGGIAAFVDAEHALDAVYASRLGVDIDALLVAQPDTGEQALDIVEMLVRSGALDVIVVDSVAALVPSAGTITSK
jgi:hypothetical protein